MVRNIPLSTPLTYSRLSSRQKTFALSISIHFESQIYQQAVQYPHWKEAMATEISALDENQTWNLTFLPTNKHPIGCKWIYKVKYKSDGSVKCYKTRLVAKDYT